MSAASDALTRVHLTAGENLGWAIDEDLRLLERALAGTVQLTSLREAAVVHAVWWHSLIRIPPAKLDGKHLIAYADNAPAHYILQAGFIRARPLVDTWIGRSREALRQFADLGIEAHFAPYTVDTGIFRPLPADDPALHAARARWAIPEGAYLVANFHRDTDGRNLGVPKYQKGPDLFVEILRLVRDAGVPVHALLAGPRRHWLRGALAEASVPCTFAGNRVTETDDMGINVLSRAELNTLYNLGAVHLVSSRWEGGPHSILEAAASRCRVASTRVGIAADVLDPRCLFNTAAEGAELLIGDARHDFLRTTVEAHHATALADHSEGALRTALAAIYAQIPSTRPSRSGKRTPFRVVRDAPVLYALDRLRARVRPPRVWVVNDTHDAVGAALVRALSDGGAAMVQSAAEADVWVGMSADIGAADRSGLRASCRRFQLWLETPDAPGLESVPPQPGPEPEGLVTILPSIERCTWFVRHGRALQHPFVVPLGEPVPTTNVEKPRGQRIQVWVDSSDHTPETAELLRLFHTRFDPGKFELNPGPLPHSPSPGTEWMAWITPGIAHRSSPVYASLRAGIPVLYPCGASGGSFVGLGGLSWTTDAEWVEAFAKLGDHLLVFRRLIHIPSFEQSVRTIAAMILE